MPDYCLDPKKADDSNIALAGPDGKGFWAWVYGIIFG